MALLLVVRIMCRQQPRAVVLILLQLKCMQMSTAAENRYSRQPISDLDHKYESTENMPFCTVSVIIKGCRVSKVKPLLQRWTPGSTQGTKRTQLSVTGGVLSKHTALVFSTLLLPSKGIPLHGGVPSRTPDLFCLHSQITYVFYFTIARDVKGQV